jgi:2-iminoacetate synthase ThiH
VLDNILNFQASWPTMGHKVAQTALFFGANDYGSTMLEENVVSQAGAKHRRVNEREIVRQISEAGFKPVQRGSLYETLRVPDVEAILADKPEVDFGALETAF